MLSASTPEESLDPVPAQALADRELVDAILQRDRKATAEFVARHSDAVYSYVRHRLLPRNDCVEDIMQDVFLSAWQQLPAYEGRSSLQTWLLGIARHKVFDHYRARLREPRAFSDDDGFLESQAVDPQLDELLDREKITIRTRRILSILPEPSSLVLLWRYWEKRSTVEMAALTGRSQKGLERLLARAREQFRKRWHDEELSNCR